MFLRLKEVISSFFEKDEVSRLCPGKKDTVTYKKIKKQKRYLNDSLKNLFILFKAKHPEVKVSYSRFCRFRPFWVLFPTEKNRETCLCIIHENFTLLVTKLKSLHIINAANSTEVVKEICCDVNNEECLGRLSLICRNKEIQFFNVDDSIIIYKKWLSKKVEIIVKGEKKMCQKTIKEEVESTKENIVSIFKEKLPYFLKHLLNIKHQYKCIDTIKNSLKENEVFIHLDFSENYICKYGREIQSAHFGGSKPQISLHTVMVYTQNKKSPMCTFSENLRHDPFAICAHLTPIAEYVKTLISSISMVHFLSDGPSTQYKNKTMFFLIVAYISKLFTCQAIRWHYSESGHGKGAPDGIGGCLKRTADSLVAQGKDLDNFNSLIKELRENCKGILCHTVSSLEIKKIENEVSTSDLKTFKGTMTIREVVWTKASYNLLEARTLSCLTCGVQECCHYKIGTMDIPHLNPSQNKNDHHPQMQSNELLHGTSGKQNKKKEVKFTQRKRVQYKDIYSSDSDSDEMTINESKTPKTKYSIRPKLNNFIVVKLSSKKYSKNFVGLVINIDKEYNYTVKFLKKIHKYKFVFPKKEDVSTISLDEVVCILTSPDLNKREQYIFSSLPSNIYIS
ncbi:uncharacterized protein [Diabrotica undecimpunctata]|uniref:uncharacterized protein n=1 Tax=Diabrotica undecimpunctata TaxID=50387 RepID=UPI003B6356A0